MHCHLIQGINGCRFAVERKCVTIVVDALRASATAAMLFDAGATELVLVASVEDAFAAKAAHPEAILAGERGGLPPEGFDMGNSPRNAGRANGRTVIFTTTTGSQWMVQSTGAADLFMGTTVNATAVAQAALVAATRHDADIVLIPSGLSTDPDFSAQEDWVAATVIASKLGIAIETGRDTYEYWLARIEQEGVDTLLQSAPHAEKLRTVGLTDDIAFCARIDVTDRVPVAVARTPEGVIVRDSTRKG